MLRQEIFHLTIFILISFAALKVSYIDNLEAKSVKIIGEIRGDINLEENYTHTKIYITYSSLKEIEGRKAFLLIRGNVNFKGKYIKLKGSVKVRRNKIYIRTSKHRIYLFNNYKFRDFLIDRYVESSGDFKYKNLGIAFLFGEPREILKPEVRSSFLTTGLIHLLVISGLHVGVMALILSLLLPRPYGYILSLVGIIIYTLFVVNKEPPILRASIMFVIFVLSLITYRNVNTFSVLLFSGYLILLTYPEYVYSYSFWMSFIATAYIILTLKNLKGSKIQKTFLVSLSAFTGTAPIISSFSFISPISIILSPLLIPIVFTYSLFGIISIFTLFYIKPFVDMFNFMGFIFVKTVSLLDSLSYTLIPYLSLREAVALCIFGLFTLYLTKSSIKKFTVLLLINSYLVIKSF